METRLKTGDTVKLKSGGPSMTVLKSSTDLLESEELHWNGFSIDVIVECIWYDKVSASYRTARFHAETLEIDNHPGITGMIVA